MKLIRCALCLLGVVLPNTGHANAFEVFARGSYSRNYINSASYIQSLSAATGLAITLIPQIRLEARYTNATSLQNVLNINAGGITGTLNDFMTQTSIYSLGVDFDLLGPQSTFQPYLYVGIGYVQTERSYYFLETGASSSTLIQDPTQTGISGNLGVGFRLRISTAFAFECEAFAYGMDIHKPQPLFNFFGSIGVRLFI